MGCTQTYIHTCIYAYLPHKQRDRHTHIPFTFKMDILAGNRFHFIHNFYFRFYSRLGSLGSCLWDEGQCAGCLFSRGFRINYLWKGEKKVFGETSLADWQPHPTSPGALELKWPFRMPHVRSKGWTFLFPPQSLDTSFPGKGLFLGEITLGIQGQS